MLQIRTRMPRTLDMQSSSSAVQKRLDYLSAILADRWQADNIRSYLFSLVVCPFLCTYIW